MKELAEKVVELRLASRRACMCENQDNVKKSTLSLRTKVLYLISKGCSPKEITLRLCIAKTNLALITTALVNGGLILKTRNTKDKREIIFSLTAKGKKELNDCLETIAEAFKNILTGSKEKNDAIRKIDEVLEIFSYLSY